MTPQEQLQQLEARLREEFGCWTRYKNDVFEQYGKSATIQQRIAIAEAVLREGSRGIAGHILEVLRREKLGRTPD